MSSRKDAFFRLCHITDTLPLLQFPVTISFCGGKIAARPLCCQQRPTPRTRREQGVPFLVRAPQMETISLGSVGRSSLLVASGL